MSTEVKSKKLTKQISQPGQHKAIELFHTAAQRVPAYKDFLKKSGINHTCIVTPEDFSKVPLIDKKNYLTQYSLADLSWDGNLFNSRIISVSSGSTGSPFFWPRGLIQDQEGAWMHERLYKNIFGVGGRSSLVVICFSMGTWIAGAFTASSTMALAGNENKLNVITPGIEIEEAVKVIKQLAPNYEQVILCGYPPFLKDIIEQAKREGVRLKGLNIKFLFAGEAFSEEWRDYVLKLAGVKNPYSSVNIYGTADAAMLGHETPVSITARRIYGRRPTSLQKVFGNSILPSLVQYYPERRYFEAINGELIFTANSGLPLVRYNIHDGGGVMSHDELTSPIEPYFTDELRKNNIAADTWRLPFVYLNGRKDFTVTIYAVNIYPENIKAALIDPVVRGWVTGRFTMATKYRGDMDQYFEVNIELAKGVTENGEYLRLAKQSIIAKLCKLNAEYNKLYASVGKKSEPNIHLITFGNKEHFGKGIKHKWVRKK